MSDNNDENVGMEYVGWGFWWIAFGILVGPSIYIVYQASYDDTSMFIYVLVGAFIAGGGAAFAAWIANVFLQRRIEKIRKQERETARKQRKKRK